MQLSRKKSPNTPPEVALNIERQKKYFQEAEFKVHINSAKCILTTIKIGNQQNFIHSACF